MKPSTKFAASAILAIITYSSEAPAEALTLKIAEAQAKTWDDGKYGLLIILLDSQSSQALARFSKARIGKNIEMRLGKIVERPNIKSQIGLGPLHSFLKLTPAETEQLAADLVSGKALFAVEDLQPH